METPMRLAVLGSHGSWYCDRLSETATAAGHECSIWDFSLLTGAICCGPSAAIELSVSEETTAPPDAVIVRSMPPGALEQVVFRMDVLGQLAANGTLVVNSARALECAIDKFLTTARLARCGLPVPATVCCETAEAAFDAWHRLGQDVLVKPLFGSEGRGIVRVSDPDMAWRVFRTLERIDAVLYLQQFLPHDGSDVRIMVLGDEILGGMKRRATSGFRTNVAQQGLAEPHQPTSEESRLALQAAAEVGSVFAGVDLLYSGDRIHVIEVNAVPGWRAFERVTGVAVAERLLEWIEQRLSAASAKIASNATSPHPGNPSVEV
jgi:RimK family alpha-L-glutamate ligase